MNQNVNWDNLKYFIALAKTGRLQKAAKLLGSNHTTVYRRIQSFEKEVKLKLFESTPSGYFLTSAGGELFTRSMGLEEKMDEVYRFIGGIDSELKGNICITTTSSLASTILPKILVGFKNRWPDLAIDLKVSDVFFNLSKREADIAIRPASKVPLHLIGRKIGNLEFGVFASPSYLKKKPNEDFLKDLKYHDFVALDDSLAHLKSKQWLDKKIKKIDHVYRVDSLTILAELCNSGLGVAVLPLYFLKVFKKLKLIHKPTEKIGSDLWILTHKDLSQTPRIKICKDFLVQELKNELKDYLSKS